MDLGNENYKLEELRNIIDDMDLQLLHLLNERGRVVQKMGGQKKLEDFKQFNPVREREMINMIASYNEGPFETITMQHIFKTIFKASLELQEINSRNALLVSRKKKKVNTIVDVKGELLGNGRQTFIMGPCAVESLEQVRQVAQAMKKQGLTLMRGGAFKPRTSPYDFQGLGIEGLEILRQVADEFDLAIISEILNPNDVEFALDYVDTIQVGARNMQNFELLRAVGKVKNQYY